MTIRTLRLYLQTLAPLFLGAIAVSAMPLASAKVILVKGTASYGAPGEEKTPIAKDTVLGEGDSIITGDTGVVYAVFSNGVGLTVEENSNLVFSRLEQRPFWRDDEDEVPKEEISQSKFILELKYGSLRGHAKGLRDDSEFRIKTSLGDVLALENLFFTELYYDSFQRKIVLNVQNVNGLVDLITKFSGSVKFGRKSKIKQSYDPNAETFQVVRIPPKRSISMQGSTSDPAFRDLVKQFPKSTKSRLVSEFQTIEPFVADQEVTVVSDNGSDSLIAE